MVKLMFGTVAAVALVAAAGLTIVGRGPGASEAGVPPHVSMSPLMETEPVGAEVEFDILIENVFGFGGYKFDIEYDPEVLDFEAFTSGPFLESTGRIEVCQDESFPEPGIVRLGCTTTPPPGPFGIEASGAIPGPTGDGTIGEIEFRGLCAGQSSVTFSSSAISNDTGADVEHDTSQGATATITGKPLCSPEPTETPPAPTSTPPPTAEPTATPPAPTSTPPPTSTPIGPTATAVPPTPTLAKPCGDANSSGAVDSIDALVILQKVAGFLEDVPNPDAADVNDDGNADSLDSLLILQKVAGLLQELAC